MNRGQPVGRENAAQYFDAHRYAFERVIEEVQLCQPPYGTVGYRSEFECSSPNGDEAKLRTAISSAEAIWLNVAYDRPEGAADRSLSSVGIVVHYRGLSYSGQVEQFIYEFAAADNATYQRREGSSAVVEREPLTQAPHHWYWWKIDR